MTHEQGRLERQAHPLDEPARAGLGVLGIAQLALERAEPLVEPSVGACGLAALVHERVDRLGIAAQRAQDVEADHVARSFPDRLQRLLAVDARQHRLLDVAVPAEALERLGRVAGPRLQTQYFATAVATRANASSPRSYARASRSAVSVAASDSTQRSASTLRISGWSTSSVAERRAMRRVMRRLLDRHAHRGGRAEHAVEPRVVDHLDDRRHAASLLADEPRPRGVELDLARRVRAVAELVLEPLDVEAVARPVREHARDEEAREPAVGLREHEERVAHRRRAEPLVPGQLVLAVAQRPRGRHVRADVRAALPLGHRHAAQRAALLGGRPQRRVVVERREQRLPLGGELGLRAQRGDGRVRHRDRAAVPGLDLRHEIEERRPRDVRAGARLAPRERVQPVLDARLQQRVPGRMELDLVDPVRRSGRACAAAAGSRSPGGPTRAARRSGTGRTSLALVGRPAAAFALERLGERPVLDGRGRIPRAAAAGSRLRADATVELRSCAHARARMTADVSAQTQAATSRTCVTRT